MNDLKAWTGCARPQRMTLEGRYARLEPLEAARHGDDLFKAATKGDADARHRYLGVHAPKSRADYEAWLSWAESHPDAVYSAIIDKASGKALGRQSLMRIDAANGVVEIGDIHWGPDMAGTRLATEAFFLHAAHIFDDLGYRRFEWKLNNDNAPSHRAARRFGFSFEGIFRQHMVIKGLNRDTAWYAMTDGDWPAIRRSFENWLSPDNFDSQGRQRRRLEEFRAG
ncbi:MAG: GNAT family N-acetyltransferase [Notoacmeibacter sp.]|nr:GNAT family N-acetyltransferase [Notoacmeibacter sp.]